MKLVHVAQGEYVLDQKLAEDFAVDEVRTENLISVYTRMKSVLYLMSPVASTGRCGVPTRSMRVAFADYRFNDQILAFEWDRKQFQRERYQDINSQQTQTADANWFFLKSSREPASAVLLIHGFLSEPS